MEKETTSKFCGVIDHFSRSYKVPASVHNIPTLGFLHNFVDLMEEEPSAKFYGVFSHFSPSCEVTTF